MLAGTGRKSGFVLRKRCALYFEVFDKLGTAVLAAPFFNPYWYAVPGII